MPLRPPYEALLLPVTGLPMPEPERVVARRLLDVFTSAMLVEHGLEGLEVFIHMAGLSDNGSAARFAGEGAKWIPKLGMGVWPDRPPPAMWKREEFEGLGPGERPRTLRNHVFRISGTRRVREGARSAMLGWGSVIQVLTRGDGGGFLQRAREVLCPPITDANFKSFPFYMPLFEGKTLLSEKTPQLDAWFCGASVYLRESPEDGGILIASHEPLAPVLLKLGGEIEQSPEPAWRIPLQ
jgi:hypothetical protein